MVISYGVTSGINATLDQNILIFERIKKLSKEETASHKSALSRVLYKSKNHDKKRRRTKDRDKTVLSLSSFPILKDWKGLPSQLCIGSFPKRRRSIPRYCRIISPVLYSFSKELWMLLYSTSPKEDTREVRHNEYIEGKTASAGSICCKRHILSFFKDSAAEHDADEYPCGQIHNGLSHFGGSVLRETENLQPGQSARRDRSRNPVYDLHDLRDVWTAEGRYRRECPN